MKPFFFFFKLFFIKTFGRTTNFEHSDQTASDEVESDLSLHCLPGHFYKRTWCSKF